MEQMIESDANVEKVRVFEMAAELFGVLATPMRLRILSALCDREKSVSQLLQEIDTTQPNLSQHLNLLYRAGVLAKLAAQEAVEITARQGAWAGITTAAGQQGWVRVLNLRTASGEVNRGGDGSLAQAFRTGSTSNDVSTGVKGLGAEDLRNASPDEAEAAKLAGFAATPDEARAFAGEGRLERQDVDYLATERGGRRRQR